MASKWNERPKHDRWAIIGAFAGMIVAGFIAFQYAFYADTIVRYLIMVAGLLLGFGAGKGAAVLSERS